MASQGRRRLARILTGLGTTAHAASTDSVETFTLENSAISVTVALHGGFILSVCPAGRPDANPVSNRHFICCDRWGPASKAEQQQGMTWHGEAMREDWTLGSNLGSGSKSTAATMSVTLPMAGLTVTRRLKLLRDSPVLLVEEDVANTNSLGRVYNLVQHPTLGPPFLDEDTVVDSNATTGFAQAPRVSPGEPNVELPVSAKDRQYFTFPQTANPSGTATQTRTMEGAQEDDVASYIIPDGASVGWCTATSSKDKLVLGYVWPPEDYPWLSLYRSIVDGKIAARGLEFGTGGLHQPFEVLIKEGPILGRPNVHWLDAGKTRTFRYGCFLLPAADGTVGVSNVALSSSELVVKPIQAANASGALDPTRTLDTDVELTDGSAKYDCCRTRRSHVDAARPA